MAKRKPDRGVLSRHATSRPKKKGPQSARAAKAPAKAASNARVASNRGRKTAKRSKPPARQKAARPAASAIKRQPVKRLVKSAARRPKKQARPPIAKRQGVKTSAARASAVKAPAIKAAAVKASSVSATPPSSLDMDQHGSAARSGRAALHASLKEHADITPEITAGDVDANWENAYFSGDEAPGGDNPSPEENIVEDIGKALGVEYQDDEDLQGSNKIIERDEHRWELDPASSEDYKERK